MAPQRPSLAFLLVIGALVVLVSPHALAAVGVTVPSSGAVVSITIVRGVTEVRVSGTYNVSSDPGDIADAGWTFGPGYGTCNDYGPGDNHDLVLRVGAQAFMSAWLECDPVNHTYSTFVACPTAGGCTLQMKIQDDDYRDNRGSLQVVLTSYPGAPIRVDARGASTLTLVSLGPKWVFGAGTYQFSTDDNFADADRSFGEGYGRCTDLPDGAHDLSIGGSTTWNAPCSLTHVVRRPWECPRSLPWTLPIGCLLEMWIEDNDYRDNSGSLDVYIVPR